VKVEQKMSDTRVAGVAIERVFAQSCRDLVEIMHNRVGIETAEFRIRMDESPSMEKSCVELKSAAKIVRNRSEFWRIAFWRNRLRAFSRLRMRASVFTP